MMCSATGGRGERGSERKVLPTCCQKIENYFNLHKTKNGIKLKCNATLTWGLARTMRRGRDKSTKGGTKREGVEEGEWGTGSRRVELSVNQNHIKPLDEAEYV